MTALIYIKKCEEFRRKALQGFPWDGKFVLEDLLALRLAGLSAVPLKGLPAVRRAGLRAVFMAGWRVPLGLASWPGQVHAETFFNLSAIQILIMDCLGTPRRLASLSK